MKVIVACTVYALVWVLGYVLVELFMKNAAIPWYMGAGLGFGLLGLNLSELAVSLIFGE